MRSEIIKKDVLKICPKAVIEENDDCVIIQDSLILSSALKEIQRKYRVFISSSNRVIVSE